jgi:putative oxidoreductase
LQANKSRGLFNKRSQLKTGTNELSNVYFKVGNADLCYISLNCRISSSMHGSQKLFGFPPAGHEIPSYIMLIAGPIEFFGGLLIIISLWTHWVAFICSGETAYAFWSVHITRPVLPIMNGGELAIIYCFLFLFIASKGSGGLNLKLKKAHGFY